MTLYDAVISDKGFRPYLRADLASWRPMLTLFKVLSGRRDFDEWETGLIREATGIEALPDGPIRELWISCGRRASKTTMAVLMSAYYALWGEWEKDLQPGEHPMSFVISPTLTQTRVFMDYTKALFQLKHLRHFVEREMSESVWLRNGARIEARPASWRSSRGWTCGFLCLEECAYFRFESESAVRDVEIYTSLKPATTTIRNSLTVGVSTPFARQGLLFSKFSQNWGRPGPVLCWRLPTWKMNLGLTEEALRRDFAEQLGEAEFNCEFGAMEREDIEAYLPGPLLDAAIVKGRTSLEPKRGVEYFGFCDPSEGLRKGGDSMTFAVAHREGEKSVLDCLLEFRPPFNPKQVIETVATTAREFWITKIVQDRHAIGWIASDLDRFGISVEPSEFDKSKIYEFFAVLMNKSQVELLGDGRLRTQIMGLQRILRSGGGVTIDHLRGGHDDSANATAGALVLASREETGAYIGTVDHDVRPGYGDDDDRMSMNEWFGRVIKRHG
jgi:hypothetical protein